MCFSPIECNFCIPIVRLVKPVQPQEDHIVIYFTTCHPASRLVTQTFPYYLPTCDDFVSICFRDFYDSKDLNCLLRTLPHICDVLSCRSKLSPRWTIVCASSLQHSLTPSFHSFSFFPNFAPFLLIRSTTYEWVLWQVKTIFLQVYYCSLLPFSLLCFTPAASFTSHLNIFTTSHYPPREINVALVTRFPDVSLVPWEICEVFCFLKR